MAIYGGVPGDVKFKDLNNDGKIDAMVIERLWDILSLTLQ